MVTIKRNSRQKLYTSGAVQELADYYIENGGEMYELVEGTLGWGTTVMVRDGWKSVVVQEVYVNEWSSGHTVRRYDRLPKKHQTMLEAA